MCRQTDGSYVSYAIRWAAPLKAGVHSEQHFHYMASKGEVKVDQAHRGYSIVDDSIGKVSLSSETFKFTFKKLTFRSL